MDMEFQYFHKWNCSQGGFGLVLQKGFDEVQQLLLRGPMQTLTSGSVASVPLPTITN